MAPELEVKMALDYLVDHPNCAPVISFRLIQRFVTSNPTRGYVYRVAQRFGETNGDLGAVIKAILLDPEARDIDLAMENFYGKPKEPILRATAALRALKATTNLAVQDGQGDMLDDDAYVISLHMTHTQRLSLCRFRTKTNGTFTPILARRQ